MNTTRQSGGNDVEGIAGPITVVLADDHPSIRAGLRLLLDTAKDIKVVGEASDGATAVQQVGALGPDVVIMDARMPGTDGLAAAARLSCSTSNGLSDSVQFQPGSRVWTPAASAASKSSDPATS